jgi:glyoxylase-like metal-dependent hydrolase (beta-lactamase superfamily II)
VDKGIITYRVDMGKRVEIPVVMALVNSDDGNILFDTGLNPQGLLDPVKTWGERAPRVSSFGPEDDVRNRLKELNLGTDDIRYVVNSHLHWDHTEESIF